MRITICAFSEKITSGNRLRGDDVGLIHTDNQPF